MPKAQEPRAGLMGATLLEHEPELGALLRRLGANQLASHVASGVAVAPEDFDAARAELDAAVAVARASGEQALLAAAVKRALGPGVVGGTLGALLSGDRSRLPTPAVAPAPSAPPAPATHTAPVAPAAPPLGAPRAPRALPPPPVATPAPAFAGGTSPQRPREFVPGPEAPFALTVPSLRPSDRVAVASEPVTDEFAWAAVALTAIGILFVFKLPVHLLIVVGPLISLAVVTVLVCDRRGLQRGGCTGAPGWGWVLLPPGYLFRRGRALGHRPLQAYALVALGIGARVGLVVFGFSGGHVADMSGLQSSLAADYADQWGSGVTAECPARVPVDPDTTFQCTVASPAGHHATLTFQFVGEGGAVEMLDYEGTAAGAQP